MECSRETGSIFFCNKKNVIDGGCTNSDFELNVKKKTVRFKAGAELSSSVNKIDVDLVEDVTDTHEILAIGIAMRSEKCIQKVEV